MKRLGFIYREEDTATVLKTGCVGPPQTKVVLIET